MMKFLIYTRGKNFLRSRSSQFTIAFMKLFSALYCELVLIIMITYNDDIANIIKDFVALGFIVEIDDMFAQNMKGYDVERVVG